MLKSMIILWLWRDYLDNIISLFHHRTMLSAHVTRTTWPHAMTDMVSDLHVYWHCSGAGLLYRITCAVSFCIRYSDKIFFKWKCEIKPPPFHYIIKFIYTKLKREREFSCLLICVQFFWLVSIKYVQFHKESGRMCVFIFYYGNAHQRILFIN